MPLVEYDVTIGCGAPDPTPINAYIDTGNLVSGFSSSCVPNPGDDPIPDDYTGALNASCGPVGEIDTDDTGVCVVDEEAFTALAAAVYESSICAPEWEEGTQAHVTLKGRLSSDFSMMSDNIDDIDFLDVRAIWVLLTPDGLGTMNLFASRLDGSTLESVETLCNQNVTAPVVLTRYERSLPQGGGSLTLAEKYAICKDRLVQLQTGTTAFGTYSVAFLGIRAIWGQFEEILTQPPQRVFPREDGLLGPGARRNYPPPRSRQRSSRVHGGYL